MPLMLRGPPGDPLLMGSRRPLQLRLQEQQQQQLLVLLLLQGCSKRVRIPGSSWPLGASQIGAPLGAPQVLLPLCLPPQ